MKPRKKKAETAGVVESESLDPVSEDNLKTFLADIAIGIPVRRAASASGFSAEQFYRRLNENESIAQRYARAKEQALEAMADDILSIADDGLNDTQVDEEGNVRTDHDVIARSKLRIDTRKWIMAKLAPKKYGDKVQTEHSVSDGLADLMRELDGGTRGLPKGA